MSFPIMVNNIAWFRLCFWFYSEMVTIEFNGVGLDVDNRLYLFVSPTPPASIVTSSELQSEPGGLKRSQRVKLVCELALVRKN